MGLARRHVEEITRSFGLGEGPRLVGRPARGELGQVWRVETSTGCWAVKELFKPGPEADAERAASFQEAAVAAGVPAPAIVRTEGGQLLLDVGDRQFRVYSWVDVEPKDPDIDPVAVGEVVASLHRLPHRDEGTVHPWYTEPVGVEAWDELVRQLTEAGSPHAEWLAASRSELCALEHLLAEPTDLQSLHLDLWSDNLRAAASGGVCVLDWENSGPGDPSQELAVVLFEFCSESADRAASLHQAYVEAGGPGRVTRPEDFSMAIAQLGHILEWQCGNWLRSESPEARQHAAEAIDEFVTRPLTREVVERVVGAVT